LRAQADAKLMADPTWAVSLRPQLLELRTMKPEETKAALAELITEIEKE